MHARFEPLPTSSRSQDAYDTARALRERPGEWARIETLGNANRAHNLAYRIRAGSHRAFHPAGDLKPPQEGPTTAPRTSTPATSAPASRSTGAALSRRPLF
ncbi:hypothetical protein GCM10010341_67240 [Streptomyces noursei]|nr:hypothetical protein GCM10010341_67240 [Streptomyces noursei]